MPRPELSFHTAGARYAYEGSYIIVNQAYVQYIPPVPLAPISSTILTSSASSFATPKPIPAPLPILFVHGGGLTGATWESTPDRRPGWAMLASRRPHSRPVYLIDTVDSGRSQKCPDSLRNAATEHRTAREVWQRFRMGPPDAFGKGVDAGPGNGMELKVFDDGQFPVAAFDALVGTQSARRRGEEQYVAEMRGLQDAIREIGRCQIVAHSNGAAVSVAALADDQGVAALVESLVLVEPGVPMREGEDAVPVGVRMMTVWGSFIGLDQRWVGIVRMWEKLLGEKHEVLKLEECGIRGCSHFPMSDSNSAEVFEKVMSWLQPSGGD